MRSTSATAKLAGLKQVILDEFCLNTAWRSSRLPGLTLFRLKYCLLGSSNGNHAADVQRAKFLRRITPYAAGFRLNLLFLVWVLLLWTQPPNNPLTIMAN